jgi:hypothetical protein
MITVVSVTHFLCCVHLQTLFHTMFSSSSSSSFFVLRLLLHSQPSLHFPPRGSLNHHYLIIHSLFIHDGWGTLKSHDQHVVNCEGKKEFGWFVCPKQLHMMMNIFPLPEGIFPDTYPPHPPEILAPKSHGLDGCGDPTVQTKREWMATTFFCGYFSVAGKNQN